MIWPRADGKAISVRRQVRLGQINVILAPLSESVFVLMAVFNLEMAPARTVAVAEQLPHLVFSPHPAPPNRRVPFCERHFDAPSAP